MDWTNESCRWKENRFPKLTADGGGAAGRLIFTGIDSMSLLAWLGFFEGNMDILASHYQALTTIHYKLSGTLTSCQSCNHLSSTTLPLFLCFRWFHYFRAVRCSVHSHWTVSETEGKINNIESVRMSEPAKSFTWASIKIMYISFKQGLMPVVGMDE